jgi:ATP-dependent RNA helicase RhlE
MSFTIFNFNQNIAKSLHSLGYVSPTPIQERAIKPVLEGRDLIGLAQTGTGKTAAFVLPILQKLSSQGPSNSIRALIVAPTRELAEQTGAYIKKFSNNLNLRHCVIYGGVSKAAQVAQLRQGVDIVVACPGRLLDIAGDGAIRLDRVETLVLDEADQMLDRGFLPDIRRIVKGLPVKRQNLVFSATMPREIRLLLDGMLTNPVEVTADHTRLTANVSHTLYQTERNQKNSLLQLLLAERNVRTAIVFTRTKHKARSLATQLDKRGFRATSIQGNLSQQKRQKALSGFKDGTYTILVATDIAARGIDIAGISHVINYDMPSTTEAYTHRTGRTGRARMLGEAVTFATSEDDKMVEKLRRALRERLVRMDTAPNGSAIDFPAESGDQLKTGSRTQSAQTVPARAARRGASAKHLKAQRTRGKRSSQRNRAAAFDFGI